MSLSPSQQRERFRELIQQKRLEIRRSKEMTGSQGSTTPGPTGQNAEEGEVIESIEATSGLDNNPISHLSESACPRKRSHDDEGGLFVTPFTIGSSTGDVVSNESHYVRSDKTQSRTESDFGVENEVSSAEADGQLIRKEDINIRRSILRLDLADLPRIPKKKKLWGETEDRKPIPSASCQCPVRHTCPHIPEKRVDCRTYAPLPREHVQRREYNSYRKVNFEKQNNRKLSDILEFTLCQEKLEKSQHEDIEDVITKFNCWIDKMRFFEMNQVLCDNSKIVPKIKNFLSSEYPFKGCITAELRDDLTMLRRRWHDSDFNPDIHRGIVHRHMDGNEGKRLSKKLDPGYEYLKSHEFYGMGKLVNGQCYLNQLELIRDGIHGKTEAGIDGEIDTGARSIILSCLEGRDDYADRDMGDTIDYVGTSRGDEKDEFEQEGDTRRATNATQIMFASIKSERPIRVIRSWRLPEISRRRPRDGFRLDGLYRAVNIVCIDPKYAVYKFRLVRLPGQTRIRTELPSDRQLEEFKRRRMQEESIRNEYGTYATDIERKGWKKKGGKDREQRQAKI